MKRATDIKRKVIYFGEALSTLKEKTPERKFSKRLNSIVERYWAVLERARTSMSQEEKNLLQIALKNVKLHEKNFNVVEKLDSALDLSGLQADPCYDGLYEKVKKAGFIERLAIIEEAGL
jgi:hypothetical protein